MDAEKKCNLCLPWPWVFFSCPCQPWTSAARLTYQRKREVSCRFCVDCWGRVNRQSHAFRCASSVECRWQTTSNGAQFWPVRMRWSSRPPKSRQPRPPYGYWSAPPRPIPKVWRTLSWGSSSFRTPRRPGPRGRSSTILRPAARRPRRQLIPSSGLPKRILRSTRGTDGHRCRPLRQRRVSIGMRLRERKKRRRSRFSGPTITLCIALSAWCPSTQLSRATIDPSALPSGL